MRTGMVMLAAVAVLAGCGKSKEREVFDERETICNGLALGAATGTDAFNTYLFRPCNGGVSTTRVRMDPASADECPYDGTPLQMRFFLWFANDPTLCSTFGCAYYCEIRYVAVPGESPDPRLWTTQPICGRVFRRGQIVNACP